MHSNSANRKDHCSLRRFLNFLYFRPWVAGIHGNPRDGCFSLALSGGYPEDIDLGECFTYTGEGGRNLKGTRANPKVKYEFKY